jgi:chemotaxis protein MotC
MVVLAVLLLPMAPVAAAGPVVEPHVLVRELKASQDRIARGDYTAFAALRERIAEIGAALLDAEPQVWKEPRNARALLLYVLSGGDPKVLRTLLARGPLAGVDEAMTRGVLAFAEGRQEDAEEDLGSLDALKLDASLAGHVSLIQASLAVGSDLKRAEQRLDAARLLAPGTLVEEAALRRQVFLAAGQQDLDRFETLALQYLRRFPQSVYADSFRAQFAIEVARLADADDPARRTLLEARLAVLPNQERRTLYLSIGREAILGGKIALTRLAMENAGRVMEETGPDRERIKLYSAAALVVSEDFEKGRALLATVSREALENQDRGLLAAALDVASQMRRPEVVPEPVNEPPPPRSKLLQASPSPPRVFASSQALGRAQKTVSEVDQLLAGGSR